MAEVGDFITPQEIARRMGVCVRTVYNRVLAPGSGLPYHQVGRRKVVGRRAFEAWLNGEVSGSGRDELRDLRQAR